LPRRPAGSGSMPSAPPSRSRASCCSPGCSSADILKASPESRSRRVGKGVGTAFLRRKSIMRRAHASSVGASTNAWARRTIGFRLLKFGACAFAHPTIPSGFEKLKRRALPDRCGERALIEIVELAADRHAMREPRHLHIGVVQKVGDVMRGGL